MAHEENLASSNHERVPNEADLQDTSISGNEDDFFDAEEDCGNRPRLDSNSSFDIISDDELNFT